MLLAPLQWILGVDWEGERADLSRFLDPPRTLQTKLMKADEIYSFDLLFVHRDADAAGMDARREEIASAVPSSRQWDKKADPKAVLHQALRTASGRTRRDARNFSVEAACHRLSEDLTDFSPLRRLQAFQQLEADIREMLARMNW
jgi:hypothetical protein